MKIESVSKELAGTEVGFDKRALEPEQETDPDAYLTPEYFTPKGNETALPSKKRGM
jgi:hypothetical protein